MEGYADHFSGKRVTVMGLGLLGRGLGDAEFLAKCGARVLVTDKKSEEELATSVERLKKYPNVTFHLGGHHIEDFTSCDMVVKAAGVPLDSPEIESARKSGVPVVMSTALFAKYASEGGATIVGVTGTRGKSTVAHMIFHCLRSARLPASRQTHLGGNVRGLSTLALLPEVEPGDICVLELDSWQLQGFGDLQISPHVSVFTNLMPDHLNYYRGDPSDPEFVRAGMEKYFSDKANIFRFQKEKDILIAGEEVVQKIRDAHPPIAPRTPESLPAWNLRVVGAHNIRNAMLAREVLHVLGMNDDEIRTGLESFEGVEGRLQFVSEKNGVKIYNDNNATTPEATIEALKALDLGAHNIILIAGGADKSLDLARLVSEIGIHAKKTYLLKGTGSERLSKGLRDARTFDSLEFAFHAAFNDAREGDIVLFSPAFASFGMFKNEYDRNDQFMHLVSNI